MPERFVAEKKYQAAGNRAGSDYDTGGKARSGALCRQFENPDGGATGAADTCAHTRDGSRFHPA